MRLLPFVILTVILFAASCSGNKDQSTLDQALIESFKVGKFTPLEDFLPTREFYKSMGKEFTERSDAEIDSFLSLSNDKVRNGWGIMRGNLSKRTIDPGEIKIKDVIVYNPFKGNSMEAMILVYDYYNRTWDDVTFIVKRFGGKTYLLEIPNPTKAFSFYDSSLSQSSQAKAALELNRPEFQQAVQQQVKQLINWAKADSAKAFGENVVYHGYNEGRSWKSSVNMADSIESSLAVNVMQEVKAATKDCADLSFGEVKGERESEGYWIVQTIYCSKKPVRFAFLKVKDKMLLGNIVTGEVD